MEPPITISTANTIVPRHVAAMVDNVAAMVLSAISAKSLDAFPIAVQVTVLIVCYLAYYFVFEACLSRTPGKFFAGLVVIRRDGSRITARETVIRTAFRFLEVNPILLGALPAAVSIVFSRHNQRIGDLVAGTIVVPIERIQGT